MGHQHGEFVAAEPRSGVALAQTASDPLRGRAQQSVTGGVPEGVVDELEAVEVDEEHGEVIAVAPRGRDRLVEPVGEQRPIGETRQLVVGGQLTGAFAGDVELDEDALIPDGVQQTPDQEALGERAAHQIPARAGVEDAFGEAAGVGVREDHHRDQRMAYPGLGERRERFGAAVADVEQEDVGLVALEALEGLGETRRVIDLEARLLALEERVKQRHVLRAAPHEEDADFLLALRLSSSRARHPTSARPLSATRGPGLTAEAGRGGTRKCVRSVSWRAGCAPPP